LCPLDPWLHENGSCRYHRSRRSRRVRRWGLVSVCCAVCACVCVCVLMYVCVWCVCVCVCMCMCVVCVCTCAGSVEQFWGPLSASTYTSGGETTWRGGRRTGFSVSLLNFTTTAPAHTHTHTHTHIHTHQLHLSPFHHRCHYHHTHTHTHTHTRLCTRANAGCFANRWLGR
jgi:hypothetical protein